MSSVAAPSVLRIQPQDNVVVALRDLAAGETVGVGDALVTVIEDVPAGHKLALHSLALGADVVKYGFTIGRITAESPAGSWIHSHNLKTKLEGSVAHAYRPRAAPAVRRRAGRTFAGFRRASGRVGTRNELWILNTVGCVNRAAERIASVASERYRDVIDGVHSFSHPYGCSQLGDDLGNTQKVLAGLLRHPNAGGVLVLGLGCENNQMAALLGRAGEVDASRLRYFNSQDVEDEIETGLDAVAELVAGMRSDRREECSVEELLIGLKCGGSDGFSGVSANPLVGRVSDRVIAEGGGAVLTEVPEMFGAESVLLDRAVAEPVFGDFVRMVDDFKEYFIRHGQPIYENPSPGNKAGGLTTLEEKSLGAVQKGGSASVTAVLRYGEAAASHGLSVLEAPGNDGVSSTAMVAAGVTVLLFTTGRGTPLGFPVPTVKISSNREIARKKPHWIDFDAGRVLDGSASFEELEDELLDLVLDVASGRERTNNEKNGYREIAIWKEGVTL